MKSVLVLSLLLCVAVVVQTAAAVPVEDAVREEKAELPVQGDTVEAAPEDLLKVDTPENGAAAFAQGRVSCPNGWENYQGGCYLLVDSSFSWPGAETHCASLHAQLASAHSIWEYQFLQQLTRRSLYREAWMGGFYFQGKWRWDDGTVYSYENWYHHYYPSSYPCIVLNSFESQGWSNDNCNLGKPFICVRRTSLC